VSCTSALFCTLVQLCAFNAACGGDAKPDDGMHSIAGAAASAAGAGAASGMTASGAGGAVSAGAGGTGAIAGGGAGTAGTTAGTGTAGAGQAGSAGTDAVPNAGSSAQAGSSGVGSPATCSKSATATPGETTQSITVGELERSYVRYIPPGYTGEEPLPVVIDFHPLGSTGNGWKGAAGWDRLADEQNVIVLWPNGIDNSWNAGRCCRGAFEQNIDDVGFVRAMIAALEQDACIDAKRIYATGCSNGGAMSFKVACDAADVIAAVAPVDFDCATGETGNPSCGSCSPARPITEIQFRGTADNVVPYAGGIRPGGSTEHGGAEMTFAEWKDINTCTGSAEPFAGKQGCETYPTCGGGVETVLCSVQNGGHCSSYQSFGIVELAWETFQRHALP
jgi:polyhydroxybutyrate depolymerase